MDRLEAAGLHCIFIQTVWEKIQKGVRMTNPPRSRRARPAVAGKPTIRRKNMNIDQEKLDRAVEILGARSETEAIDQALDLLVFREELLSGIDRIAGNGGIENYFDEID
jgi:hypothetical protein